MADQKPTTTTQVHMSWREKEQGSAPGPQMNASNKIPAGVCGILLGALGVHKFILGYTKEGVIMLLVTLLTFGLGGFVIGIIGLVEGIIYLTRSDEQFVEIYVANKRGWF